MKPEIIALVSALGGIFIAQSVTLLFLFFSKRFEYKKEIKRVIISTATEDWKQAFDFAGQRRGRVAVQPLSSYIRIEEVDLNSRQIYIRADNPEKW